MHIARKALCIWVILGAALYFICIYSVVYVEIYRDRVASSRPLLQITCAEYIEKYKPGLFASWRQEMLRYFQLSGTVTHYFEDWEHGGYIKFSDGTSNLKVEVPRKLTFKFGQRLEIIFRMWRPIDGYSIVKIIDQQTRKVLYDNTNDLPRQLVIGSGAFFGWLMPLAIGIVSFRHIDIFEDKRLVRLYKKHGSAHPPLKEIKGILRHIKAEYYSMGFLDWVILAIEKNGKVDKVRVDGNFIERTPFNYYFKPMKGHEVCIIQARSKVRLINKTILVKDETTGQTLIRAQHPLLTRAMTAILLPVVTVFYFLLLSV